MGLPAALHPCALQRARWASRFPAPDSFSTKDEVADYLESYAARFDLPVRTGVRVRRLSRNGTVSCSTPGDRRFEADNVVVAMGSYQLPRSPEYAAGLAPTSSTACQWLPQRRPASRRPRARGGRGQLRGGDCPRCAVAHPTWLAGNEPGRVPFRPGQWAGPARPAAVDVPRHRPPGTDRAHADRAQDTAEDARPRCARRAGQAGRLGRRGHRTGQPGRRHPRRAPPPVGRPRPSGRERHLVYGIRPGLLLDRPSGLRSRR